MHDALTVCAQASSTRLRKHLVLVEHPSAAQVKLSASAAPEQRGYVASQMAPHAIEQYVCGP